jgi:tRNA A-37 threonylcarbamoyl transferase component Bud32
MSVEYGLIAGRYRLREPVGTGGMGRVWLATDEMLDRQVAIKEVIPPEWLSAEERASLRVRTEREARAAARLNHPNVVKIYDVVETGQWPWIVMEYVPSRSLQQVIREDGPLAPARAAAIGVAVLDALRAAHQAGVLHRDVKPHNVLIAHDGRVVLTDFGLAALDTDGTITNPDMVLGSAQYIAPERAKFGISNELTDLWSFGATLYAAVEGHSPYARTSSAASLTALATEPPDPAKQAGALAPVLNGLLRKDPRQRLDPAAVDRMLRRVAAGASVPRGRARLRGAVAVLTLVAAIGVVSVIAALADRDSGTPAAVGPSTAPPTVPSAASSFASSAAPSAASPGVRGCDQRPAVASPVPAGVPGPPKTDGSGPALAPMPGWLWFHDATDFYIAVPPGWAYYQNGHTVCFLDPLGFRVLGVDTSYPPMRDPVGAAKKEAKRLVDQGYLPGYRPVILRSRQFAGPGAEWEFTFDGPSGRRHAVTYFVTSPDRTYAVFWVTPEVEWQPSQAYPFSAISTFRP